MSRTLESEGIINQNLHVVQGPQVAWYNHALKVITGLETKLKEFRVDIRGESPEMEAELGPNYLQNGPAHRFAIIVSPDQRSAPLIHEEFSFDRQILDGVFLNAFPAITIATGIDSLYGELDDSCPKYETIEDLLSIRKIRIALDSPSDFVAKTHELVRLNKLLTKLPSLLIANSNALRALAGQVPSDLGSYGTEKDYLLRFAELAAQEEQQSAGKVVPIIPKRMVDLVRSVGDIRRYNLKCLDYEHDVVSFCTRLFDGVAIFREDDMGRHTIDVHHPDELDQIREIIQRRLGGSQGERRTYVIYNGATQPRIPDSEHVRFIDLQDPAEVIKYLTKNELVVYDPNLLELRMIQAEDQLLLQQGVCVADMNKLERQRTLKKVSYNGNILLHMLAEAKRGIEGHEEKFDATLRWLSRQFKEDAWRAFAALAVPADPDPSVAKVTNWVLSIIDPTDYKRMLTANQRGLEHLFARAEPHVQAYIVKTLKGELPWAYKTS